MLGEPTNDMDTDMLAAVEDLLDTWPGTLLVISHDRYFMERVTDHQFAVRDRTVRHLPGGIDEYLQLDARSGAPAGTGTAPGGAGAGGAGGAAAAEPGLSAADRRRIGKEVQALGRRIDRLEATIAQLDAELAAHDQSDFTGLAELTAKRGAAAEEKDELELEWLELSEELEG